MESNTGNILQKLLNIQTELKAPKGQYNSFGKYHYRSAEDIIEAVKPLCKAHGVVLTIKDDLVQIGERYYVKATATLMSVDDDTKIYMTSAYAREDADKKGMDGSQITGAASSYARKYALNGLFCIDDTKDADTKDADTDEHAKKQQAAKGAPQTNNEAPILDKEPPPDDPGSFVIHAKGKIYDGYTIRQIHLGKGGPELLEKMCKATPPIGTPAYETQQTVVRYLEKHSGNQLGSPDNPF